MALSLVTGTLQTNSGATTTPKGPAASSYAFAKDDPGEAILRCIAGNLDQPSTIRYGWTKVNDVFRNAAIDADPEQRRDGFQTLMQVNEVWKVYDSGDSSVTPYYLPVSGHLVLKLPVDALVDMSAVVAFATRVIGSCHRGTTQSWSDALTPLVNGVCATDPD